MDDGMGKLIAGRALSEPVRPQGWPSQTRPTDALNDDLREPGSCLTPPPPQPHDPER